MSMAVFKISGDDDDGPNPNPNYIKTNNDHHEMEINIFNMYQTSDSRQWIINYDNRNKREALIWLDHKVEHFDYKFLILYAAERERERERERESQKF